MSELKDYDIMDIEAMDDERLEKSESGRIQVTRVYLKSEADKVIAEKDAEIKNLQIRLVEIGKMVQKRDSELDSIKGLFREFNDKVCKKIVDASRTMSAISQDAQMDFYEEFIKEVDNGND